MNQYEAMFLFDPTFGSSFENCEQEIRRLMERAEAEIIICRKWDERRLAYRIKGRKRGVYVLTYFKAKPEKISPLERDAMLSESVLRMLVLRADGLTREAMERAFVVWREDAAKPTSSGEKDTDSSSDNDDDDRNDDTDGEVASKAAIPSSADETPTAAD